MVDITITPLILALSISNIILFIIAIFLFLRCRKLSKKSELKKEGNLTGIADITPQEFKPERFELKPGDVLPVKTGVSQPDSIPGTGIQEKAPLKLEDELPDVEPAPMKKGSKKKKIAKKAAGGALIEGVKEVSGAAPEKPSGRKKKIAKNESEGAAADVIKELTEISVEKKASKKKKAPKKEPGLVVKEAAKEEKAAVVEKAPDKAELPQPAKTGEGMAGQVQVNLPKQ